VTDVGFVFYLFLVVCLQQDYPFSIRIPESIPPSIALESPGIYDFSDWWLTWD